MNEERSNTRLEQVYLDHGPFLAHALEGRYR